MFKIHGQPFVYAYGQTEHYWPMANTLLDSGELRLCHTLYFPTCDGTNSTTAMREPVPVILFAASAALTGRSLIATVHVQVVLHLMVLLLLYLLVRRWRGERAALIAALCWALWLPTYQVIPQLSGDLVGTVLLLLSALLLQRTTATSGAWHWSMVGVVLGLAVLCRSVMIVAWLPWAWWLFRSRRNSGAGTRNALVAPLVMVVALGAVLLPWALRNKAALGRAYVGTSMNGYNVFRNSGIVATDDYLRYVGAPEAQRIVDDLMARRTDLRGNENEAEMDAVYMEEGVKALKAHPGRYVLLSLYRFVPLWTNLGVKKEYGRLFTLMDAAIVVQQVLLLPLFLFGWYKAGREAWPWALTTVLAVLAYMAVVAQVRYLIPVMPFVLALAAPVIARVLPGGRTSS